MAMPSLNLVQWSPWTALSGRLSGSSILGGPITARDTLRTTHGQEAFVSAGGEELFFHGMHFAFNECFPGAYLSEAAGHARIDGIADKLQDAAMGLVRFMHYDGDRVFQSSTGARCAWWLHDPKSSTWAWQGSVAATCTAEVSPIALDRFHYMVYALKQRGIRIVFAWDHPGLVLRALGLPVGGGDTDYPLKHYWDSDCLSYLKQYLKWFLDLSNPYTGKTLGEEEHCLGLEPQNERSFLRSYNDGAGMIDTLVQGAYEPYYSRMKAEWSAYCVTLLGVVPYKSFAGDGFVGMPTKSYDGTAANHPIYSTCDVVIQRAWTRFVVGREQFFYSELESHISATYPDFSIAGGTGGFSSMLGNRNVKWQSWHWYEYGPTTSGNYNGQINPSVAAVVTAVTLVSNVLTVTISGNPLQGGGETDLHPIYASGDSGAAGQASYVRLSGINTGSGGFVSEGDWQIASRNGASPTAVTQITIAVVAANQTITLGGTPRMIISARCSKDGGDNSLASVPPSGAGLFGIHEHLAGKPMIGGMELSMPGFVAADLVLHSQAITLGKIKGHSGYCVFSWGAGTDMDQSTMLIPHAGEEQYGRMLWQALMARMTHYGALDGSAQALVESTVHVDSLVNALAVGPAPSAAYSTLNPSDFRRPVFRDKRFRMTIIDSGSEDIATSDERMGSSPSDPYDFGNPTGLPRWLGVNNTTPDEGSVSATNRIEYRDQSATARGCGVVGLIHNGRYGKLKVTGLPTEGWYGGICWVTDEDAALGAGRSLVGVVGMSANLGFAFCDPATRRQYLGLGSTAPAIDILDGITITLDTGSPHTVSRVASSSAESAESTASWDSGTARTSFTTGATPLWILEPVEADAATPAYRPLRRRFR